MISRTLRRHSTVLLAAAVFVAAVLAASVTAPSADAARPDPPGSTTTISVNGCQVTGTFSWDGFGGKGLTAQVGLYYVTGTNLNVGFNFTSLAPVAGKTGTFAYTINLTGSTPRTIYARGSLLKGSAFTEVSATVSRSGTTFTNCGPA